ncbi:MAG: 3-dehydroquinate synthase [Firmicutes bacterium]|nr:3-dehydroquinate synthase [Bacillota bacterium]MBQ1430644.1 3-dehydroquinate synthase [Bacillota bacterium]MBQ1630576.1 3-dehydroquinate synthase [Bacillota bacterium]MBQ1715833.1 3-dehydroquinate synthase [Bacillota bacterium]MBQ1826254.1 3-dehydroquinate synthase [Bacillota bacterium]
MERVKVRTRDRYEVLIGRNITDEAVKMLLPKGKHIVLIWDEEIPSMYVAELGNALEEAGKEVMACAVHGGEDSKSIESFQNICGLLSDFSMSRSDTIVGIGGGTVTDLAGFIASTYKRGLDLCEIPTTLIAAADAAIGGKNALNLGSRKNIIGTFYQPSLVVVDTKYLDTLPDETFAEGCSEVIKYGFVGDQELVSMLEDRPLTEGRSDSPYLEDILKRCIRLKADIVVEDEKDNGIRNLLNFGHTLGHAIETQSSYKIHHGEAVAMGMALITRASENKGLSERGTYTRLINLLEKHHLEWRCPYNLSVLLSHVAEDKKIRDGYINLVVPLRPGACTLKGMTDEELRAFLDVRK